MLELAEPGLDHRGLDASQLALTEVTGGVEPQSQLGGFPRGLAEGLGGEPAFSELGEGDLARVGVDVGAAEHVGCDRGQEPLSVLLAVEHARAFTAVGIVVAGLPAAALAMADCADVSPVDSLLPEVLEVCHVGFPFVTAAHRHGGSLRCDRGASRRVAAGWGSDRPRRSKSYSAGRRRGEPSLSHVHPCSLEPFVDLVGVEAQQMPPLQERDAPLGDETAYVALVDAQVFGDRGKIDERRAGGWCR